MWYPNSQFALDKPLKIWYNTGMYIIKTISKNKKDSEQKYYSYRMMESVRVGKKVKKITLLNLGSNFDIEQKDWAVLSTRVNDILNQTSRLFELSNSNSKFPPKQYSPPCQYSPPSA